MRINSKIAAIVIVVILFGGIALTTALGYWQTENTKIPQKYSEGEFVGEYNPEDIRGSYALSDIADVFGIPVEELAHAFGIDEAGLEDPASFKVKDLGTLFPLEGSSKGAIETSSVRLFVALYKGLPYEMTEECSLPRPAVEILKEKANLTEEQKGYLDTHVIELSGFNSDYVPTEESGESA